MKATMTFASVLTTVLALAGVANAQTYVTPSTTASGYGVASAFPSYGGYGYGYHSSTYEEGVLRGLGDLTRARGEARYFHSLANINNQEAFSRYLQNREQKTETYFRMQQVNRAAREAKRPQRLSPAQYVALAKKQAPDNLSEAQYDRTLGRLSWPAVFLGDEFAVERNELDRAFMVRSPADAGAGSAFHANVKYLTSVMQAKLREKIDYMSPMEYIAARKFVDGLAYEAQQPLVVGALAAAE